MKKSKLFVAGVLATVFAASAGALVACGDDPATDPGKTEKPGHTHVYQTGDDWTTNATDHWHKCTVTGCTEKKDSGKHTEADENGQCTVCHYQLTAVGGDEHDHVWAVDWSSDSTHHWHACSVEEDCEEVDGKEEHLDTNEDGKCDVCDYATGEAQEPDTVLLENSFYLVGNIAAVGEEMWGATVGYRADKGIKIHLTPDDTFKVVQYKGIVAGKPSLEWLNDSTATPGVLKQYASSSNNAMVAEEGDYFVKGYAGHFLVYKVGTSPAATCDVKGDWTNGTWDNTYGMKSVTPAAEGALYQFEYTIKIQNPAGANFGVQFYTTGAEEDLETGWCNTIAEDSALQAITAAGTYKFTVTVTADGNSIKIATAAEADADVVAPYDDPNKTTVSTLTVNYGESKSVTLKITHPEAFEISSIHAWGDGAATSWPGAAVEDSVVNLAGHNGTGINLIIVGGQKQTVNIEDKTLENGATYLLTITPPGENESNYGCTFEKEGA